MCDSHDLPNPDGSPRSYVHRHPNRHPPTSYPLPHDSRHHNQQQNPWSTYHYHPPQPQAYNYSTPVTSLVWPMTNQHMNVPHRNYQNNTVAQECFQQQVSLGGWNPPRGPPEPLPTAIQTTSLPQSPPPPVLTPQPVPFPPYPLENLPVIVPNSASIQHDKNKKQKNEEEMETEQVTVDDLEKINKYKLLGQGLPMIMSCLEDHISELNSSQRAETKLRAENEVLKIDINELKDENNSVKKQIEEISKKAEEDVKKSKTEEASWRQKCIELNEQQMSLKRDLEEKDRKILSFEMSERKLKKGLEEKDKEVESLSKKKTQGEIKINEQENEISQLQASEQKLTNDLKANDEEKKVLNKNCEQQCEELSKLQTYINKLTRTNEKLNAMIANFKKKEKANEKAMQTLQSNLKSRVEELQAETLEKCNEITKASSAELEEKNEEIKLLKEKCDEKCKQLSKLQRDSNKITRKNKALNAKVAFLVKKDNANKKAMENLKLKKSNENTKASSVKEKLGKDNQVKILELTKGMEDLKEKMKGLVEDLKDQISNLECERDNLKLQNKKMNKIFSKMATYSPILQRKDDEQNDNRFKLDEFQKENYQNQSNLVVFCSSSFEKESRPPSESSSSSTSMAVKNEDDGNSTCIEGERMQF